MAKFIKLTYIGTPDKKDQYINIVSIYYFYRTAEKETFIQFAHEELSFFVTETPDEIMALIAAAEDV